MKKKLFGLLLFPVLSLTYLAGLDVNVSSVAAMDGPSISNEGDAFALIDKSYSDTESFVYTADMHFRSGKAGGLVFGANEGEGPNRHYFVINTDRDANRIKFMYFYGDTYNNLNVDVLLEDWFIGNDKTMTQDEKNLTNKLVKENLECVNLKVVVSVESEHTYAEFFVEGIKRFGIDTVIDLRHLPGGKSYAYQGGQLGVNCYASDIYFNNVEYGRSDYSYFSELYRNQYHLQPFSKWSNDPNALVYHNGYYHVFYQYHPFGLYWGPMFWAHARSQDLIHYEFLPICLFPEMQTTVGGTLCEEDGYMWSGCAIDYKAGMSSEIDSAGWFTASGGNGIYAVFTREGVDPHGLGNGRQNQVIISSDDGGMTWTKRKVIPQSMSGVSDRHVDFRDPKIFPVTKDGSGNVTLWGMTLAGMDRSKGWFLKSTDLVNWTNAGEFNFPRPECIGVGYLEDELHNTHAYITNKSRTYLLGDISYDSVSGNIVFTDETGHSLYDYTNPDDIPMKPLDFGPDTYASQSFYINDALSEFNGKEIVLNWFSGDLNADYCTGPGEYAGLRGRWNGGFTMPVEYGLKQDSEGLRITQKPVTVNNVNLEKTNIVSLAGVDLNSSSANPLSEVHTHIFELDASITTHNDSPIVFKVDVGDDEYMEFGWNKTDGYYVDRTNLDDKGIRTNVDWHAKYASHILGDTDTKTFYVLSDNGGLEVFCEDYSLSFYFVTTASVYSTGASLKASDATINNLELNEVKSIYRGVIADGEGVLYVSTENVELGTSFPKSKFVTCYFTGTTALTWETISNDGVVSALTSNKGINLTALKTGTASFRVSVGAQSKEINVTVHNSSFDSDFSFDKDGIVSGNWIMADNSIIGERASGNGFILSSKTGDDFTFTGQFSILSGAAASLVFRASNDMSKYLVANYDANDHIVKLWSTNGELARSGEINVNLSNITLSIRALERNIDVKVNGVNAINNFHLPDSEPLSGRFGLNVFSGKAEFKSLDLIKENYNYSSGDLVVVINSGAFVKSITNMTMGNTLVYSDFYYQEDDKLHIKQSYFDLLENGMYRFSITATNYSFIIKVDVHKSASAPAIEDVTVQEGYDVTIYIGTLAVSSLKINGQAVPASAYHVSNYTLVVDKSYFSVGDNTVLINGSVSFKVSVLKQQSTPDGEEEPDDDGDDSGETTPEDNTKKVTGFKAFLKSIGGVWVFVAMIAGAVVILGGVVVLVIFLIKRKKSAKGEQKPEKSKKEKKDKKDE